MHYKKGSPLVHSLIRSFLADISPEVAVGLVVVGNARGHLNI